jgi:hypothetical protein
MYDYDDDGYDHDDDDDDVDLFGANRALTDSELREIRNEEGCKPAFLVAEDFGIENWRVRAIWDGIE